MIRLHRVTKRFGSTRALVDVSFGVDSPGLVALLGPNGAGKSTAMRIIAGSIMPDGGTVEVAGMLDPAGHREARRRIGYLPETASMYPEMSVRGYLRYRCELFGVARSERGSRIGMAMDRCELDGVARRRVGTLSKGYRQRVGLAATLLHEPAVMILDEPTSGLDPSQIRAFRGLLRELGRDRVVLLSTHVLAEVEAVASRVIVLGRGKVLHDGPMESGAGEASGSVLAVRCRVATEVEPERDAARVAGLLLSLDGVVRVEASGADDGWHRLRVSTDADLRETASRVSAALASAGRAVCELAPERVTLESRFLRLMDEGEGEE